MNTRRIREIFAEELDRNSESRLAEMVRMGSDNSHGGTAAIAAMQRVKDEAQKEIIAIFAACLA